MSEKDDLRAQAARHRERIDPASEPADEAACLFAQTIPLSPDRSVAAYWPKGREFPTFDILADLMEQGVPCALPLMREGSRVLSFARWRDGEPLAEGPFGIRQPIENAQTHWIEPDIVLVPLLAFDRRGHRLGHGMGYYDATLADLRSKKPVVSVGLAWAQQAVLFNLPAEPHDQPLDYVITPLKVHCFLK
jgi:5-formyltetrahydrofolate cyclo-ligase